MIPNLMVTDMDRSVAFYRDVLGYAVEFAVDAERETRFDGSHAGAVFVTLTLEGSSLMLQTRGAMIGDIPGITGETAPQSSIALYLRDVDPRPILGRAPESAVLKGPERSWYGMLEVTVADPDGYVITIGHADGPPPA
ncbi:MAG: VOC family protein [Pseudomonadota bacterium]